MNSRFAVKRISQLLLLFAALLSTPVLATTGGGDEFGIWTGVEASKKLTRSLELDFEGEFRTQDALKAVDRWSAGLGLTYKILPWLKADGGYTYIYSFQPGEKSIKEDYGDGLQDFNFDHAYWTSKNRFYFLLVGSWKLGRFSLSLRERLQYTRTGSAVVQEDKWRCEYDGELNLQPPTLKKSENEEKSTKHRTYLRSRVNVKYNIPKCKFNPFLSVELYSRSDEWRFHEKIRYRIGSDYKLNKKNTLSLYYLYQDANDNDEPAGHAVGLSYGINL